MAATDAKRTRAHQLFRWDLARGPANGLLETCFNTFALLVAIRYFEADDNLKAWIPAGMFLGMLLNPLWINLTARRGWPLAYAVAVVFGGSAAFLGFSAVAMDPWMFVLAIVGAKLCWAQAIPLMTHLYGTTYLGHERGRRVSSFLAVSTFTAAALGYAIGALLEEKLEAFVWVFALAAIAAAWTAFTATRMPVAYLDRTATGNPIANLGVAARDRVFMVILLGWMVMGVANLMTIPLRTEYMANPIYGVNASEEQVGIVMVTIPQVLRVVTTKIWGGIFDRSNLISMRLAINLLFMASVLSFFLTEKIWMMGLAMGFMGLAQGGAGIIWTLWVTKIAPPEKTSVYMSVHTLFTGIRGSMAPFLGYMAVAALDIQGTALLAAGLIGLSTLMFVPLRARFAVRPE